MQPSDITLIRTYKQNFADVIEQHIQSGDEGASRAIDAADQLELTNSLLPLITLAESSGSQQIKRKASEVVLRLVHPLGKRARQNRDQPTVRGPVLARLVDSVQCFPMHHNERLIEAFLEISAWPDGDLRLLLEKPSPARDLICKQLEHTTETGAIELLAGFVRRRELPACIVQVIGARSDRPFRDALLNHIGQDLTGTVQKNLQAIGLPTSCKGGEVVVDDVDPEQLPALIHLYVSACPDVIETLQVVAAAAERGGDKCMAAATIGLAHCQTPDASFWMQAAIPVADGNPDAIAGNENARLLNRLIKLLQQNDGALVRSVRQILSPLQVENIIGRLESLRPRSRRRLGKVVMMIDADAITRVRDALRHPVLRDRLNAIAMTEALGCVDLLAESLAHIAREDHQDARIRAAEVMGAATDDATLQLLEEMTRLPECGVRDAAVVAIQKRQLAACQ